MLREKYNDIILHVRFKENNAQQQQETLGVLGTNLIHSAFFYNQTPKKIIKSNIDKNYLLLTISSSAEVEESGK